MFTNFIISLDPIKYICSATRFTFGYRTKCSATPCDLAVIIVYHKCLSGFVCKRNPQCIATVINNYYHLSHFLYIQVSMF